MVFNIFLKIVLIGFFYVPFGCVALTFPTSGAEKFKTSDFFAGTLKITSGNTDLGLIRRRKYGKKNSKLNSENSSTQWWM
jgi:hypothetical protein